MSEVKHQSNKKTVNISQNYSGLNVIRGGGGGGGDSLIKVGTDVRARALGFSGVNFCPGIRLWEVNFARALGFWQFLPKNV